MDKKTALLKTANTLVVNTQFLADEGLMNGKTGVALFLYRYADYSKNERYADFAGDLLDGIVNNLDVMMPFDFDAGLSGIAWAIDCLIRDGFVDGNPDVIFEEIDEYFLKRVHSQKEGMTGNDQDFLLYYRLRTAENRHNRICDKAETVLQELSLLLKETPDRENPTLSSLLHKQKHLSEQEIIHLINSTIDSLTQKSLALEDGLAGYGLKLMQEP